MVEFLGNTVTRVDYTSYELKTSRTLQLLSNVKNAAFITFYHNVKFPIKADILGSVPQLQS